MKHQKKTIFFDISFFYIYYLVNIHMYVNILYHQNRTKKRGRFMHPPNLQIDIFNFVHIRKLFYSLFIFFKMVQHIIYKLNRFRSTTVAIFA